jgi:hypothetical protein
MAGKTLQRSVAILWLPVAVSVVRADRETGSRLAITLINEPVGTETLLYELRFCSFRSRKKKTH